MGQKESNMSYVGVNTEEILDDFPAITAGEYIATVNLVDFATDKDTNERKTDKNGNEYLRGDFVISEGEFAGQHVYIPYLRVDKQDFRDLCYSAGLHGVVEDTDELTGCGVTIKVTQETYQDKLQSKVSGFIA